MGYDLRRWALIGLGAVVLLWMFPLRTWAAETGWNGTVKWETDWMNPDGTNDDPRMNFNLKLGLDGFDPSAFWFSGSLSPGNSSLQQLCMDFNISQSLFLRIGRQRIIWGTGYAWNPTNAMGADKNRADLYEDSNGKDRILLEFKGNSGSWTGVAGPENSGGPWGFALKRSMSGQGYDVSFSLFTQGSRRSIGGDFSGTFGHYVAYGEIAWKTEEQGKSNRLHAVAGMNRAFVDGSFVIVEAYFNQDGGETSSMNSGQTVDYGEEGKRYLFLLWRKDSWMDGDLTLGISSLVNLDDRSYLLTPEADYNFRQNASLLVRASLFHGGNTTEFGGALNWMMTAGLSLSF